MTSLKNYEDLISNMLLNAPDPHEPLPVSNRKETLYGATLPFLIASWAAIAVRVWVRFRVMREPGWDDYLVIVAGLMNTAATVFVLHAIDSGLGRHFLYLGIENWVLYQKNFYFMNALYITEAAIIKASLLLQYLRIFKAGFMRWICLVLLVTVMLWGFAYGFMVWFPCFPVQAFWRRTDYPNAICYGFGLDYTQIDVFIGFFESHTALNMVFDIVIFATPMVLFTRPQLSKFSAVALAGVFAVGATVVMISIWRLYSILEHRAATIPYIDFTWWSPITLILSCLEINLAITCASMPVFWPHIEKSITAIFVTHEIHMSEHNRLDDQSYEMERTKDGGRLRLGSVGSVGHGGSSSRSNSQQSLTRERSLSGGDDKDVIDHYKDPYNVAQIDPLAAEEVTVGTGVTTNVGSHPDKPKWNI